MMLTAWIWISFTLAFARVLASFSRRTSVSWRSQAMRVFALLWYFTGFTGWCVSGRREALMGGLLVSVAWTVAALCARTIRKPRVSEGE